MNKYTQSATFQFVRQNLKLLFCMFKYSIHYFFLSFLVLFMDIWMNLLKFVFYFKLFCFVFFSFMFYLFNVKFGPVV